MSQQNPGDLLKQVSRMRKDMDRVHEELRERYVEASVAGERVEVTFNGQQEMIKISLSPSLLEPDSDGDIDVDMLEDLIVAAVNAGLDKSKELMNEEMNDITGGLAGGFPGLF